MLVDELNAVPSDYLYKVVMPLLAVNPVFAGISSEKSADNNMEHLCSARYQGMPVFELVHVMFVCEQCRKRGVMERCRHYAHLIPRWHDASAHGKLRELYQLNARTREHYMRDTRGVNTAAPPAPVFHADDLGALLDRERRVPLDACDLEYVFVAIDPCGGGGGSKMAVVSAAYARHERGTLVYIGAESLRGTSDDDAQCALIIGHIEALHARARGRLKRVLLAPEVNMPHVRAQCVRVREHFEHRATRYALHVLNMVETKHNDIGFETTQQSKHTLVELTQRALMHHNLRVCADFVCAGAGAAAARAPLHGEVCRDAAAMLDDLAAQLRGFQKRELEHVNKRSGERRVTVHYCGKSNDGGFDDHVMAFMIAYWAAQRFHLYRRGEYARITR